MALAVTTPFHITPPNEELVAIQLANLAIGWFASILRRHGLAPADGSINIGCCVSSGGGSGATTNSLVYFVFDNSDCEGLWDTRVSMDSENAAQESFLGRYMPESTTLTREHNVLVSFDVSSAVLCYIRTHHPSCKNIGKEPEAMIIVPALSVRATIQRIENK